MHRKAAQYLLSSLVGLSVVAAGCAGEEPPAPAGDSELAVQGAAVVSGTSKVTLCNLPRYTKQTTVRLCGYTTPGADGSAIASAWFSVDGGAAIAVVPEPSGGFVDTSTSLAEGTHAVRLYARSAAGNLTFEEQTVTVDVTPPVLKVLSPTPADVLTNTEVNVTSSVADATAVRVQTQWVQSSTVDSGTGTVTHTVDLVNRGYNTLLVRATDAAGNTSESRVTLYFCPSSNAACFASAHWAPVIVSTSQSTPTVRVVASDPQGSPLSFSWSASAGTLGAPTSGSTTSEVVWTPPACVPAGAPPSATATVTNALGLSVSTSFSLSGVAVCVPDLMGRWTFENGSLADSTGHFGNLSLFNGASVQNGSLVVSGAQRSYARSGPYSGPAISAKTLVAWVRVDDLFAQAGTALTLEKTNGTDVFDGIVYAELRSREWMAGSSFFNRTQNPQTDRLDEGPAGQLVQMAITYPASGQINIYRNGALYDSYFQGSNFTYNPGVDTIQVIFGLRHDEAGSGFLTGRIEEAQLYNRALTPAEIQALRYCDSSSCG